MTGPNDHAQVVTGTDPTKAVLSESGLNSKHLCDYVVNVATGCRHGCKFCYVPSTPNIRTRPKMLKEEADVNNAQKEWGNYVLYRDNLGQRLSEHLDRKRTWRSTERGCGIVGISFSTDCYMDGRAGRITREVVGALVNHEEYARILTRNPILALQDLDLYCESAPYVTVGSSIPSLDADLVGAIEPRAPAPEHRLKGLKEFNKHGVPTFVSMSPTYPVQEKSDIRKLLQKISECDPNVVFHEPINPRGANFDMTVKAAKAAGKEALAHKLSEIRNEEKWEEYATKHFKWVQEIGRDLDLPIHLWPDKELVKNLSGEPAVWLQSWRDRQSPEDFAGRESPSSPAPDTPCLGGYSV